MSRRARAVNYRLDEAQAKAEAAEEIVSKYEDAISEGPANIRALHINATTTMRSVNDSGMGHGKFRWYMSGNPPTPPHTPPPPPTPQKKRKKIWSNLQYKSHQTPKLNCVSSRLAVVFVQFIKPGVKSRMKM